MNQTLIKKITPHLVAFGIGLLVLAAYFSPLFGGKVLKQFDVMQWRASYQEIATFEQASGERTFWTNSMFAGMPSYLIGATYHYNPSTKTYQFINAVFGSPLETLILLYLCFYILLIAFEVDAWLAIAGAIAFTFSTFNFINIDAGHAGKGNAIALMPLVLAGIKIALGNKKLLGGVLAGIGLSMQLAAGHLQITYYLAIMIFVWLAFEAVMAFKNKTVNQLFKSGLVLLVAAVLAVGINITNLMVTEEYGKESIRGKSELTKTPEGKSNESNQSSGLDKDYALQWSNGVSEPFTLLIPGFLGGANAGDPHTHEIVYKSLKNNPQLAPQAKQIAEGIPAYFGEQPFTAGPIYYGAIICFLFVFGLFVVKGPEKWWILLVSILSVFLSMGKNFMSLTDLFFYYVPLYNKFRSVTFILAIAQTTFPLLGLLAIRDLVNKSLNQQQLLKALYYSAGIVVGLCLLFAMMPELAAVNSEIVDNQLKQYGLPLDAIYEARAKVRQMDALRSLFFVLTALALIWVFIKGKLKLPYFAALLALIVLVDLWGVNKRYLNDKDYEKRKKEQKPVEKTMADEIILQDKDPHYRVFNTTQRLDQDALTSYYHKSIGGYHGAKMRRYQELIDFQVSKQNMEVFNMLNVKYFMVADSAQGLLPQLNSNACGNAWFVNKFVWVANADAEIDSLTGFNPKNTCYIDKRFESIIGNLTLQPDTTSTIKLTQYKPNALTYESNATTDKLAVFSEIYYANGWNAYIDDKLVEHVRCNYVLRGLKVPAGKHTIVFKFEPKAVATGETISLVSGILLYGGALALAVGAILQLKKRD